MSVWRVFSYLKRYPMLGGLQLMFAALMAVVVIISPSQTRVVIDEVLPTGDRGLLLRSLGIMAFGLIGREVFNALRIILNNVFEQKVIYDLRSDLYAKLQHLPLRWFDNQRSGDLMTRVTEDVPAMERVLIDGIETGLVASLQIIAVGTYMYFQNAQLALALLIPIPLIACGALVYTRISGKRWRRVKKAAGDMNALLHDNLAGIRQIKSYTAEPEEHARFNAASDKLRQATLRAMFAWGIYQPAMYALGTLGILIVTGYGGWLVMAGKLTPGNLVSFLFLLGYFYEPIGRLHSLNQLLQSGRAAAERVFAILDSDEESHMDHGKPLDKSAIRGHVVFENVDFSYGEQPTLAGVSLEAKPGETIALVGTTGAGKSTVINLLTRFYEYSGGSIRIDGAEIRDLSKPCLRDAIGYVTQESFLFNGSVRENLLLGKRDASEEECWTCLRAANAHMFVERLPRQLDTVVGERGVKLSVGERQRLSIARAILKNPPLLLLDEATASVDTETERLIQEALEHLMANRTAFVIAHRLSTVRNAQRIYVLERGKVIEQGTHDSLLALDGHYATLAKRDFLDEEKG